MKTLSKYFSLLFIISLFFACSSSSEEEVLEEEVRDLKLSVALSTVETLETENVDFEFEILDGNGGYTATASVWDGDPEAKVSINGKIVTVNLLVGNCGGATITVSDKKNKKASVHIVSTHKTLQIPGYALFLDKGQVSKLHDFITFGAGAPYTVEKLKGDASVAVIEDGNVKVTSLGLGDTYYKVRDKRGSVASLIVQTTLQFEMDMTSNFLQFEAVNNLTANITLLWGEGWQIISSTEKITERLSVSRPSGTIGGVPETHDVLFIHTTSEGKGTDTITLRDKDGSLAVVQVHIR